MNAANKPILLLTAAVNPGLAPGAKFSVPERTKQYLSSFDFYVRFFKENPGLCGGIVLFENSGADLAPFGEKIPTALAKAVELMSLSPDSFDSAKGKTWNEMLGIDLAVESSRLLFGDPLILKCTGRYPILNLKRLCRDICTANSPINACYFRLPGKRDTKARYAPMVDTRCMAFRKSIWTRYFSGLYRTADEKGRRFFEHIALEVVGNNSGPGWIEGFSRPPLILGKQGHTKRIHGLAVPQCLEPAYSLGAWFHHWRTM